MSEERTLLADESIVSNETLYQTQKEILLGMIERQFDYGKWVLASLLAVHGGSLLAISQADSARDRLFAECGGLLIWGLFAAVLAGGLGWINFSISSSFHWRSLQKLRVGDKHDASWFDKWGVNGTLLIAPIVAAVSMALFLWAAFEAQSALRTAEKIYWYNTQTTADDPQ